MHGGDKGPATVDVAETGEEEAGGGKTALPLPKISLVRGAQCS